MKISYNKALIKKTGIIAFAFMFIFTAFIGFKIYHIEKSKEALEVGIGYSKEGKEELAIEEFKKAVKFNSKNFKAYLSLAKSSITLYKFEEAEEALKKAKAIDSTSIELSKAYTSLYFNRGIYYIKNKELTKGKEFLSKGIKNSEKDVSIYIDSASVLIKEGLFSEGIDILKRGYELFKDEETLKKLKEAMKKKESVDSYNSINGGIAAKNNQVLYYINSNDNNYIYGKYKDGSEKKLIEKEASYLNVYNDCIFFLSKDTIFRASLDGKNIKDIRSLEADNEFKDYSILVYKANIQNMIICDNKIYYLHYIEANDKSNYSMVVSVDLEGKSLNHIKLKNAPWSFFIEENNLYYLSKEKGIFCLNLKNNEEKEVVSDNSIEEFSVLDNKIYFKKLLENNKMSLFELKDGSINKVSNIKEETFDNYYIVNKNIYYSIGSTLYSSFQENSKSLFTSDKKIKWVNFIEEYIVIEEEKTLEESVGKTHLIKIFN